jgi:hypothetical protein
LGLSAQRRRFELDFLNLFAKLGLLIGEFLNLPSAHQLILGHFVDLGEELSYLFRFAFEVVFVHSSTPVGARRILLAKTQGKRDRRSGNYSTAVDGRLTRGNYASSERATKPVG